MPNYLKMPKQQHVIALLELGWSYRRIQTETGVRRETVGRYDRARLAKAAKVFPGSPPQEPTTAEASLTIDDPNAAKAFAGSESNPANAFPGSPATRSRSVAAAYRAAITEKLARNRATCALFDTERFARNLDSLIVGRGFSADVNRRRSIKHDCSARSRKSSSCSRTG